MNRNCPTRPSVLVTKRRIVEKEESWVGKHTMPLGLSWDSWLVQGRHFEVIMAPESCDNDLKIREQRIPEANLV